MQASFQSSYSFPIASHRQQQPPSSITKKALP
uniref:Uncharacterized protein n=1 Tax=Setaria viridis TaxID=4556 RepID=A0A4U6V5I9_SETVI|nr:hypothetical protein SEVIR_5G473733v2 [Setaria viridis]